MIQGKTVLAVIPARGGSKRVPRKNLREYRGLPLVVWAIDQARRSKYIDRIIVSTEDDEIKRVCSQRAEQYCMDRPALLATDDATCEDVIRHVLSQLPDPDNWVVLLQPTSPLRTAEDIDACIERAQMGEACISYNRETGFKNGAVYVAKAEWIAKHDFTHLGTMRYLMEESRSLDINTEEDFSK